MLIYSSYNKLFESSELKNDGLSQEQIEKKKVQIRRHKKLTEDPKYLTDIIWKADDLNEYSVNTKDKVTGEPIQYTVPEYFQKYHGIQIRYPKMPLGEFYACVLYMLSFVMSFKSKLLLTFPIKVCVGKSRSRQDVFYEWYPLEFLFMEFNKINGANKVEQVQAKLDFYSHNGGKALVEKQQELFDQAMNLTINQLGGLGLTPNHILEQYNLRRSDQPVTFRAKVLKEPCIEFGGNTEAAIRNGSWSVALRGKYNSFAM